MDVESSSANWKKRALRAVIQIDDGRVREHLDGGTLQTVEESLHAIFDGEPAHLCGTTSTQIVMHRTKNGAFSYERRLRAKTGDTKMTAAQLRNLPLEMAIIEQYRHGESSVEVALIEMYLAGVSLRRIEDLTQMLWGTRVSADTVSDLNQKINKTINEWRERPLAGVFPYVFLNSLRLTRTWANEVFFMPILVAIGVTQSGYREVLGVSEGNNQDEAGWNHFLGKLNERGLTGVQLFVSEKYKGLKEGLVKHHPQAKWQRSVAHFYRSTGSAVPPVNSKETTTMLKAIHAQEDAEAARAKAMQVAEKLRGMRLARGAEIVENGIDETLSFYAMPQEHWRCLRTSDPLQHMLSEIRRRTRVVEVFPDVEAAVILVAARLRHIGTTTWGTRRYLQMNRLAEVVTIG